MEDILNTLFTWRAIERVVIVAIAGLAIGFGWELMRRRLTSGDVEIQQGGIRIALRRVAPGVIFALFGAVVLAYAITHPVTVDIAENRAIKDVMTASPPDLGSESDNNPTISRTFKISGLQDSTNHAKLLRKVVALNKVLHLVDMDRSDPRALNGAANDISENAEPLRAIRDEIVANTIGRDLFEAWQRDGKTFRHSPDRLSKEERERLEAVSAWFDTE